jgi:metal-responsive CopG/Arc/MetJ family transcriptional regulator
MEESKEKRLKGRPRTGRKVVPVCVQLYHEELKRLDEMATLERKTRSALIREAIQLLLNR